MARPGNMETADSGVGNPTPDTIRVQEKFLKAFSACGIISKAAKAAGCDPSTVRSWRKNDLLFLERMGEAKDSYNDSLEEVLNDLIQEMHSKRDYKANPTLLIFKMNGAMPEKYKGASQAGNEAKEVLSEFRKAVREAKGTKDPVNSPQERQMPPEKSKSPIEQANEIIQSKFGSMNGSDESS